MIYFSDFSAASGGGTQRQVIIPGAIPMFVNTTSVADKQYPLPAPVPLYLNEQG